MEHTPKKTEGAVYSRSLDRYRRRNTTSSILSSNIDTELHETPSLRSLKNEISGYGPRDDDGTTYSYYPGIQRSEFDFQEERAVLQSANLLESTANLIKGSLGIGVLSMHVAYMYAGLWTSLAGNLLIGCVNYYIIKMLIDSAQIAYQRIKLPKLSYSALGEAAAAMGPSDYIRNHRKTFRRIIAVCLFMEIAKSCCVYQIMIAHTLKQLLNPHVSDIFDDIRIYILINTPILIMLCMIRTLKRLAPFSFLADLCIGICVISTLYYSLNTTAKLSDRPIWKDWYGLFKFFGVCLYCTCGITIALPVENNMRAPKLFNCISIISTTVTTACTILTGFFGYLGWGEECKNPITKHLPDTKNTTALKICLLVMLWITYALKFYVPFHILWYYLRRIGASHKLRYELLCRFVFIVVMTVASILYPSLIDFMVFTGFFWIGIILFIIPAVIEYLVTWESDRENNIKWRRNKNVFLILFGIFCSVSAFVVLWD